MNKTDRFGRPEVILCAAVYVDTGKNEGSLTYAYPETGFLFSGLRHPDCFALLWDWKKRLTPPERAAILSIDQYALRGANQGFLTSSGRFVDRYKAAKIAYSRNQVDRELIRLTSEDLY